jgi:NAD(P)-dependent dehydrogenase (short-subunit alcohol dehydrogenase family)
MPYNVFITGASSGIGAALAREFHARGAYVGLLARRSEKLHALRSELDNRALTYQADITDAAQVRQAALDFEQRCGGADIVIANAGISVGVMTEFANDLQIFDRVMQTNVMGVVHTFQPFIQPMKARGKGLLVGVSSVAGVRGLPGSEAYCASKAAVTTYCESLRTGLRDSGVRVVTLAPGFIRTPMTERNPYDMPFLMPVESFAKRAVDAIVRGDSYRVIPWQMGWLARAMAMLPNPIFDNLVARRARKPRQSQ